MKYRGAAPGEHALDGWIFFEAAAGARPVSGLRFHLAGGAAPLACPTLPRRDVRRAFRLDFEEAGFRFDFGAEPPVGVFARIEACVDGGWQDVAPAQFAAQGHMWLFAEPVLHADSLRFDIGSYKTRLKGARLKRYLRQLLQQQQRAPVDDPALLGQFLATAFYQLLDDGPEVFEQLARLADAGFPPGAGRFTRWDLSVNTARLHPLLQHGRLDEAVRILEQIAAYREHLHRDHFLAYNFVKSQTVLAAILYARGETARCAARCREIGNAAFEAAARLPRTYSMASELRELLLCAQQSFILAKACGAPDSGLDFPAPLDLPAVLASGLRVRQEAFQQRVQALLGLAVPHAA